MNGDPQTKKCTEKSKTIFCHVQNNFSMALRFFFHYISKEIKTKHEFLVGIRTHVLSAAENFFF